MTSDAPIVVAFIYVFLTLNFFGWGMLHDQRFIFFSLVISFLYICCSMFRNVRETLFLQLRILLLLLFISIAVFGVTINLMNLRHVTSVEGFINDAGLQSEIAGRFFLLGKNPYRESYEQTDLAKAKYIDEAGNTVNPALFHFAYPPFFPILSGLGFRIFVRIFGWFDIRMIFLLFYFALIALGFVKFHHSGRFVMFLAFVGINPLFINTMIQGSNDIVVITILLWSLFFLEKKLWIISGALLGLAVATKQIAWIAFPIYIFFVWQSASRKKFWYFLASAIGVAAVFFMPFIIWDGPKMWEDLVLYINGSIPTSYPIHNFGLGMFLVKTWVIHSIYDYYPFWIWQVIIGGFVCLLWFILMKKKKVVPGDVLTGLVVLLSISWIFNRFMNFSYLGVLAALAGASAIWYDRKKYV